jgi:hypothetical protein
MAVKGIAAIIEPIAYAVTSCPVSASETFKSAPICGNNPAGIASVIIPMKQAVANASSPNIGSFVDTSISVEAAGVAILFLTCVG